MRAFACIVLSLLLPTWEGASTPFAGSGAAGYLLEVRGEVRLRRPAWSRSTQASIGSEIRPGDTLELAAGAAALVLCRDLLTSWRPPAAEVRGAFQDCPRHAETLWTRLSQKAIQSRAGEERLLVTAPSNTALLDPHPVFRWTSQAEKQSYRVSLFDSRDPRQPIWGPAKTAGMEIRYPGKPPLAPEVAYFVRVQLDPVDLGPADGQPFILLPPAERSKVQARRREIEGRFSSGPARDLALAIYFHSRELRQDALGLLVGLTDQSPALLLLRARILEETGVAAVDLFRAAREAAQRQADPETEAEALLGLARSSRRRDEVFSLRQQAAALFRDLGDSHRAGQVAATPP